MLYRALADLTVLTHVTFVAFVALGGFLVLRWPRTAWAHVPAAVWGALIEFQGWVCPLTPLENRFRRLGGEAGYGEGFIEHYVVPVLYPPGLTREVQLALGVAVVVVNLGVYGWVLRSRRKNGTPEG